jgi:hypothetical protein
MSAMEVPIGFITLYEAVDAVGRAMFGANWRYAIPLGPDAEADSHEPVITAVAEGCESGRITAAYRRWDTGAEVLDPAVWQRVNWRNHFMTGTIDLDLPLLDDRSQPVSDGRTARCTREIFVRRDSLLQFTAVLGQMPAPKPSLIPASVEMIRTEIRAVYLDPESDRPNVNKLIEFVQPRLEAKGLYASGANIRKIAGEQQFFSYRRKPGRTKTSEQHK